MAVLQMTFRILLTILLLGSVGFNGLAQEAAIKKIMVLAKFQDSKYQQDMENAMLRELKANGVEGLAAHKALTKADAASEEVFIARLKELGVTGLILFGDGSVRTQYKNKPSVNAGVSVPVKIGIFRAYVGGNIPLGGGTRKEEKVIVHAYYFDKEGEDAKWETLLKGNLSNGSTELARKFAATTYKKLRKYPGF